MSMVRVPGCWEANSSLQGVPHVPILKPGEGTILGSIVCERFVKYRSYEAGGGFYKRGCQVKTLLLIRGEGMFCRHPAPDRRRAALVSCFQNTLMVPPVPRSWGPGTAQTLAERSSLFLDIGCDSI